MVVVIRIGQVKFSSHSQEAGLLKAAAAEECISSVVPSAVHLASKKSDAIAHAVHLDHLGWYATFSRTRTLQIAIAPHALGHCVSRASTLLPRGCADKVASLHDDCTALGLDYYSHESNED